MHETSPIIRNTKGQRSACLFIIVMLGWINVVPNNINILIPIWSTLHVIKSKGMQEFVNDGSVGVARSLQVELLRLTLHSYTWMASTSVVGKVNHVPIFWSKWRDFTNVQATFKDGIELGISTSYFLSARGKPDHFYILLKLFCLTFYILSYLCLFLNFYPQVLILSHFRTL